LKDVIKLLEKTEVEIRLESGMSASVGFKLSGVASYINEALVVL
jgi:hypothetical protein